MSYVAPLSSSLGISWCAARFEHLDTIQRSRRVFANPDVQVDRGMDETRQLAQAFSLCCLFAVRPGRPPCSRPAAHLASRTLRAHRRNHTEHLREILGLLARLVVQAMAQ